MVSINLKIVGNRLRLQKKLHLMYPMMHTFSRSFHLKLQILANAFCSAFEITLCENLNITRCWLSFRYQAHFIRPMIRTFSDFSRLKRVQFVRLVTLLIIVYSNLSFKGSWVRRKNRPTLDTH